MSFPTPTVVESGLNMIVSAMNGSTVNFTKVKLGNGAEPETGVESMTDIVNPLFTCNITDYSASGNTITVTFLFTNTDVETTFRWSEIGLFASCNGTESLFAYTNAGDDAESVPANDSGFYEENTYHLTIVVDSTENMTATVRSQAYASREALDDHIYDYNNPHRVTAEQVGLGSVPNVTTNEQTPTFTEAAELTALTSGQTISTILGKIAKAVRSLISHLEDFNNPHRVTASQIGAAREEHTHTAAEITGGTISVTRGGTGRGSWVANGVVYASSTDELSQLSNPTGASILMQGASGAPYFQAVGNMTMYAVGDSAPTQTNLLWIDTTATTGGLKYYNGSAWVHVPVAYAG